MKISIFILLVIAVTLSLCCSNGNYSEKLPVEVVIDGTYCSIEQKREVMLTNNEDYQKLMNEVYQNLDQLPRIPVVDFSKYSLLAVFIGQRTSGGYLVTIDSVISSSSKINCYVTEIAPGKNCGVTDVITSPFAIVKIPKTQNKPVFILYKIVKDCN